MFSDNPERFRCVACGFATREAAEQYVAEYASDKNIEWVIQKRKDPGSDGVYSP